MGSSLRSPACGPSRCHLPNAEQRPGHWTYAVAWDGQMGLTIRYAEDLLRPQEQDRQVG